MARGSGLAQEAVLPGKFTSAFSHVTYDITLRNGVTTLRSRRDDPRRPLEDSVALRYYIGSGLHGRTYLFARALPGTTDSMWYEAPVNWYTRRAAYGMAPAFDQATDAPLALPTEPNCLHCHATDVAEPVLNTRNRYAGAPFKQGGIGCTACHGDMAAHVASGGSTPVLRLGALTPKKQDSVCLQCHLEGDALTVKPGRSLVNFRPGEDLKDVAVYFVNASSPKSATRASSQYEGLLRSACRRASGDRMTCTTCHDPHSTPSPAQRVSFYRSKCLQCHTGRGKFVAADHHPEQLDCAFCHMPSRAVSDVAHEQTVDHDIEIRGSGAPQPALGNLAQFTKSVDLQPIGTDIASARDLGIAYAQFAVRGDRNSFQQAVRLLTGAEKEGQADYIVHQQLGYLLQLANRTDLAIREYKAALALEPNDSTAATNLAVLHVQRGDNSSAIKLLQQVAHTAPDQTAALLDLSLLQCRTSNQLEAKRTLGLALFYNPDNADAQKLKLSGEYAGMHCRIF